MEKELRPKTNLKKYIDRFTYYISLETTYKPGTVPYDSVDELAEMIKHIIESDLGRDQPIDPFKDTLEKIMSAEHTMLSQFTAYSENVWNTEPYSTIRNAVKSLILKKADLIKRW